jgi:PAS domain S-box-containing protein
MTLRQENIGGRSDGSLRQEKRIAGLARKLEREKARRARAEEELREARAQYHSLVDQMPAGVFRKDPEGRYVFVNSWFCRIKGMTSDQMLGKTPRELAAYELAARDGSRPEVARETTLANQGAGHHETIMITGKRIEVEEEYPMPDGSILYLHVVKTPVFDAAGRVVGTQGIQIDVTRHKLAEARLQGVYRQLMEASRQAGMAEVATNVLHNVGNVLNSVNISVGLLNEQLRQSHVEYVAKAAAMLSQPPQELSRFLTEDPKGKTLPGYLESLAAVLAQDRDHMGAEIENLARNVEHIKHIVAMQQNLARPGGVLEEVEPGTLVEDALQINATALERHGVRVVRDYQPTFRIMVDRHKALQILINLITNAKQAMGAMKASKSLRVSVSTTGPEGVRIRVSDNGEGIAPEHLPKVFSQGFTTRKSGHGFGLHSSANTARELGGSLSARSEGRGQGAVFTLDLPRQHRN